MSDVVLMIKREFEYPVSWKIGWAQQPANGHRIWRNYSLWFITAQCPQLILMYGSILIKTASRGKLSRQCCFTQIMCMLHIGIFRRLKVKYKLKLCLTYHQVLSFLKSWNYLMQDPTDKCQKWFIASRPLFQHCKFNYIRINAGSSFSKKYPFQERPIFQRTAAQNCIQGSFLKGIYPQALHLNHTILSGNIVRRMLSDNLLIWRLKKVNQDKWTLFYACTRYSYAILRSISLKCKSKRVALPIWEIKNEKDK